MPLAEIQGSGGSRSSTSSRGRHSVDLVVSEFPVKKDWVMVGNKAYHTSILLDGHEYYFNREGIQEAEHILRSAVPPSHGTKVGTRVLEVGQSRHSGRELRTKLGQYFDAGSYDVLVKNCNMFTDCALAFLLSRRLPREYCLVERLSQAMLPAVVALALGGRYELNQKAKDFNVEAVVMKVDENAWMGTSQSAYWHDEEHGSLQTLK